MIVKVVVDAGAITCCVAVVVDETVENTVETIVVGTVETTVLF